jgi:hypothetical protein
MMTFYAPFSVKAKKVKKNKPTRAGLADLRLGAAVQ